MKKLYFLFVLTSFVGFSQAPGDLVITEIMNNPAPISDTLGEWFEIYNTTAGDIDINGWTLSDDGTNTHLIDNANGVTIVPAGGYLVLGRNSDTGANGGAAVDYEYGSGGHTLGNADDEVVLTTAGAVEISRVNYDGGTNFPDLTGASIQLDPGSLTETANDIGSNWCASTSAYGDGSGSLGTPGVANITCPATCSLSLDADNATCVSFSPGMTDDTYNVTLDFTGGNVGTTFTVTADSGTVGGDNPSMMESGTITVNGIIEGTDVMITVDDATSGGGICTETRTITSPVCIPSTCANPGDIIITEILYDADAVSDTLGEWFEVYNTTSSDIDMEGWELTDLGTNSHTIVPGGGITIVPANGYLVLGRSTDTSVNGNAPVDYAWTSYTLSNDDDEIIISCGATEIDRVTYIDPTPTGFSWELAINKYDSIDNDEAVNWHEAVSTYGDGDSGTPGTINDFVLSTDEFDTTKFSIYPNPVTDGYVNIISNNSEAIKVELFDLLGKQIENTEIENNQLNVSELNSGIYILKITQDNSTYSKKLIVK